MRVASRMRTQHLSVLALVAMLSSPSTARAQFVTYTSQASFLAAITNPGVDTFTGFSTTSTTASPIARAAGSYGYSASVSANEDFFGVGSAGNPWLSTNTATDAITFAGFTGGVGAVGGNFFGSNIAGEFESGDILVTYVDVTGTQSTTLRAPTTGTFFGVVSLSRAINAFTVSAVQPVDNFLWPTVDNLTLGQTTVPEPGTYALLATGLLAIGIATRRKRMFVRDRTNP
jgi:PEP-CTERM motif